MKRSDHFNGDVFFNPWDRTPHGFNDFLKVAGEIRQAKWPKSIEIPPHPRPQKTAQGRVDATLINHATVLVQMEKLNILTDPVFSMRVSPVSFIGPRRVHRPGIELEDLPPIQVVLISHNHYDHLDLFSLKKLNEMFHPIFLTSLGNKEFLEGKGLKNVHEFDWWEKFETEGVQFHFVPAQHFSSRSLTDRNRTLWGGFVIESKRAKTYFAGDTGYGPFFNDICQQIGAPDLSLLPIGAYEPRWFMRPVHMNPDDAVRAHQDLQSKMSLGIHFGCFKLTSEGIMDPVKDLAIALDKYNVNPEVFKAPQVGQVYSV